MKNRFRITLASLLAFASISLFSCNALHIHEYEWKYDEDHHWQECIHCGDKIGVTDHKMSSSNDTCIACGYKDPVAYKDENAIMTGLTKYAKTKTNVTIPEDVLIIGKGAIGSDSNATEITLHKSTIGICKGALDGSKLKEDTLEKTAEHIKTLGEEGTVAWEQIGDVYFKYDKKEDKAAMIDGKFYDRLEDAFADVKEDNTTITLLKTIESTSSDRIDVNYDINLEAYNAYTLKNVDFLIKPGSCLRISPNITYNGTADLLLGEVKERVGTTNTETLAYTSGSISFLNTSTAPAGVEIRYVIDVEGGQAVNAVGAMQYESELLETPCFAYGILKMSKDFKQIVGLTDYGATLKRLTVIRPIVDKDFDISNWAFTTPTQIRIKIPLKDIRINLDQQKGAYRHLIIGDGIKNIGYRAFSNWHDRSQIPAELISSLAPIVAPLTTLDINSSTLENIGEASFYYCAGLVSVATTNAPNLKTMGVAVFQECFNLKHVDLGSAILLEKIRKHAFLGDTALASLILACDVGWQFDVDSGYIPEDMRNPATAAFLAVHADYEREWQRNTQAKFCYYNPYERDSEGRFSHVHYTNTFENAYNGSKDGYVISICDRDNPKTAKLPEEITITKSLKINVTKNYESDSYKFKKITVNPGKYLLVDSNLVTPRGKGMDPTEILLKCDGKDNEYKNVSGVGITTESNKLKDYGTEYGICMQNSNSGSAFIRPHITKFAYDNKSYLACGLFNFNRVPSNYSERVNSLSSLGQTATEFEVTSHFCDGVVNLADNVFGGNFRIRKITFGKQIDRITRHALADNVMNTIEEAVFKGVEYFDYRSFVSCKKLSVVDFSEDTHLLSIGETAFSDCPNLKEITLPSGCKLNKICKNAFDKTPLVKFDFADIKSGWKAKGHNFTEAELTPENAAKFLTSDYKSTDWTRA